RLAPAERAAIDLIAAHGDVGHRARRILATHEDAVGVAVAAGGVGDVVDVVVQDLDVAEAAGRRLHAHAARTERRAAGAAVPNLEALDDDVAMVDDVDQALVVAAGEPGTVDDGVAAVVVGERDIAARR